MLHLQQYYANILNIKKQEIIKKETISEEDFSGSTFSMYVGNKYNTGFCKNINR